MKLKDSWNKKWSFETKMYFVIVMAIVGVTFLAIIASTISLFLSLTSQRREQAMENLTIMSNDYENNLNQYKSLTTSIVLNDYVQEFSSSKTTAETLEVSGYVYGTLLNLLYIQNNANFIAVTNSNTGTYIYNGNQNMHESSFKDYHKDYSKSIPGQEKGSVKLSFSDVFFGGKRNTLTLYFPVYSVTSLNTTNGIVIVNVDDNVMDELKSQNHISNSNLYLTDTKGVVLSTSEEDGTPIGEAVKFSDEIIGDMGSLWHNGKLVNYKKIGSWNLYLIHEISPGYLVQNLINTIIILLIIMFFVLGVTLIISKKTIHKLYHPLNKLVNKMNDVSQGHIQTRISIKDMDSDTKKLTMGFNTMMDKIHILIKQVKEEQLQLDQAKLNALQSQIQPHFLYNTLECIHWQALADGNKKISTLVKALANYYRTSLSDGHDVITLREELDLIKNYLIIQNMRYENLIDLNIEVEDKYKDVKIPKLTVQPLIENSIYHGIRIKEGSKGRIDIKIRQTDQGVCLVVIDNGVGMSEEEIVHLNNSISLFDRSVGYGINNVNKRIELMFGPDYGLKYKSNPVGGIVVEVYLPRGD